jgi:hypothetical protein
MEVVLDRAQMGFDADGRTVRVEVHRGGDPACPTESSPTPDQTVILSGLAIEATRRTDGVFATLLDFETGLTSEPLLRGMEVKVSEVQALASPRAEAFVAFDLEASLPGGRLSGHVFAPHCDSLDE